MEATSRITITPHLLAGLALIRDRVRTLPKTKSGYGYRYTPLDEILDYLKPLLAEANLVITQFPIREEGADGIATAVLSDDAGCLYSFAAFPPPVALSEAANNDDDHDGKRKGKKALMSPIQARGCDFTYLRRYSLCAIFNLAADEDTDGYTIGATEAEKTAKKAETRAERLAELRARMRAKGMEEPANLEMADSQTLNSLWRESEPVPEPAYPCTEQAYEDESNAGDRI